MLSVRFSHIFTVLHISFISWPWQIPECTLRTSATVCPRKKLICFIETVFFFATSPGFVWASICFACMCFLPFPQDIRNFLDFRGCFGCTEVQILRKERAKSGLIYQSAFLQFDDVSWTDGFKLFVLHHVLIIKPRSCNI